MLKAGLVDLAVLVAICRPETKAKLSRLETLQAVNTIFFSKLG